MPELVFNALLLGVDAVGLAILCKRPGPRLFLGVALVCATLSVPLSLLVWVVSGWRTAFGIMRLGAWAVFLHGFVLFVGGAACLRRRHRRCAIACLLGAVALVLVAVDAFLIEPTALEVTRYEIVTPKLSRPVRIGILADLQTDRIGGYERRAVELLLAEEPDLLLLLGDYVQGLDQEAYDTLEHELNALLSDVGFDAPLGCFAVRGNVERNGWPRIFDGLGVTCFERTTTREVGELTVTGLSFGESVANWTDVEPSERFHVVFGHSPNFALGGIRADLLIAGHTHGGQVRLPLIGPPIILSAIPRSWAAGRTDLDYGPTLIVSRGVGHERGHAPRLRFLCRPELVIVDLVPGN